MDDAISRQAAIDAINCDITITGRQNAELVAQTIGMFADRIKALPSAQPEREKGEWITQEFGSWAECSECHELYDIPIACSNFCHNCGADMRGEQE